MATCSSILAQKIPWTEESGGLQSMGSQKSQMRLSMHARRHTRLIYGLGPFLCQAILKASVWSYLDITHSWEALTIPLLRMSSSYLFPTSSQIGTSQLRRSKPSKSRGSFHAAIAECTILVTAMTLIPSWQRRLSHLRFLRTRKRKIS